MLRNFLGGFGNFRRGVRNFRGLEIFVGGGD